MLGKIIAISTSIAGVLLIVMLLSTSPSGAGPLGLLAVFFLLYVVALGAVTELLWVGSKLVARASRPVTSRRPIQPLSLARAYYYSTVVALAPVMLLAMASIGSLGFYDVVLVLAFLAVGILYISKR
jgi:uncharacterized membrane protein